MSLIPVPEFDRPGFCALCHCQIAEFEGARIVKVLSIARPVYVRLNDGSMMGVTTCENCKNYMTIEDLPKLMDSVYKGWKYDLDRKVVAKEWTEKERDDHLDVYGEKYIIECAEKGFREEGIKKKLGKLEGPRAKEKKEKKDK